MSVPTFPAYDLELIGVVARALRRRLPPMVELGDLIGDGFIGLHSASRRFDAGHGIGFERFARRWIRGAMLDGLRARDWLPRQIRSSPGPAPRFLPLLSSHCAYRPDIEQKLADLEWIGVALKKLPVRWRLVLQLYYLEALPMKQVGAMLGVTEARISQLHALSLKKLSAISRQPDLAES